MANRMTTEDLSDVMQSVDHGACELFELNVLYITSLS